MSIKYYDPFTRTAAGLGVIPSGPTWLIWSGTWETTGTRARCTSAASTNPKAVAPLPQKNSAGRYDVDVSAYLYGSEGYCIYFRAVDNSNWMRVRSNNYQSSYQYYVTEYQYYDRRWFDTYTPADLYREVQVTTSSTTYTYTFGQWSPYANTGEVTACRIDQPTYGLTPIQTYGYDSTQYQWAANALGAGCAADKRTYRKQSRSRTVTQNANTTYSYSYKWMRNGYSLQANESFTGNTGVYTTGEANYNVWSSNYSFTNPGKTTNGYSGYDVYQSTSIGYYTTYWAQYGGAYKQLDMYTTDPPTTRQVGPYTGYSNNYELMLEKSVAGTITQIGATVSGNNAHYPLRVLAINDTITVWSGGNQRITATDGTYKTTGAHQGIGGGTTSQTSSYGCDADEFNMKLVSAGKVWNGSAWVTMDYNVYDGSAWKGADKLV